MKVYVVSYEGQEGQEVEVFSTSARAQQAVAELTEANKHGGPYHSAWDWQVREVELDRHVMEDGNFMP